MASAQRHRSSDLQDPQRLRIAPGGSFEREGPAGELGKLQESSVFLAGSPAGTLQPLLGRGAETEQLERLQREARKERSGVFVLLGEAGVGKTALLDHAAQTAEGFRVARAAGVEAEMEMPYAALHELCGPMLGGLNELPGPQRKALEVAFGLTSGTPPEPLLVGLAALTLLANESLVQPLLCAVDDAQWLDRASAQALAFVARRFLADRVVLLFAAREPIRELSGLPELVVEGLPDDEARALLALALGGHLDERVLGQIVAEARGNPLALLELPRGLSAHELATGFSTPAAVPVATRIEDSFQRRLDLLDQGPQGARQLLLLAALEPLGESRRVWAAAEHEGIGPEAAAAALDAGLLLDPATLRFRHPLVRSATYRAAGPQERREAHAALARVTDGDRDVDRRAWHLARAATGPDEEIAAHLERAAGRAQERGGVAAAAAFLELAADLTPDIVRRSERLLFAAGAHMLSGATARAQALLKQSLRHLKDPTMRAVAMRIEGACLFAEGRGGETPALLFEAGIALSQTSPMLARESLMEAIEAAMWAGRLTSATTTLDIARAAATVPADDEPSAPSLLLTGYTKRLLESYPAAVAWWRRAIDAFDSELERMPGMQWHGMIWNATGETFDFRAHLAVAQRWVDLAKETGALATLPVALSGLGWCEMLAGRVQAAESLLSEALEISAATGAPAVPGANEILRMGILDWRGDESAVPLGEAVIAEAVGRGQGLGVTIAAYGRTILELGHGRYEQARGYALSIFEEDALYFGTINLGDVIEATVRCGDGEAARRALARLTERAEATRTPWGLGLLARGQALLAEDELAEPFYEESLAQLERSGVVTEYARTQLLYGEWLRRRRRRRDARVQLRAAHDMFQAIGAEAFASRARVELQATGERARLRTPDTRDELTPQERQIASLAAEGQSNADIGAQMFISPHTVAYHLRKVFRKLDINSRSMLAVSMAEPVDLAMAEPLDPVLLT
jgi:DNA-binding CsgD family transcriptional regulator